MIMTTMLTEIRFVESLLAEGRSSSIGDADDVYGWFIGDWELDVRRYWAEDVTGEHLSGEVHSDWVLEGLAVQDTWIMPARRNRSSHLDPQRNMYGTTLRVWDATQRAWRITWMNPAGQHFEQQLGRRVGAEVVQLGTRPDGTTTRWRFTEITPHSFHWLGESQRPGEDSWLLEGEFLARRLS
jgi:hypothetical protein